MPQVQINSFAKAIGDVLNQYGDKVDNVLDEVIQETAKDAKGKISAASPKGKTGRYSKGWRTENTGTRLSPGQTIYNTQPGLPHLLEFSHALRGGGRSVPQPHIGPVEENIPEIIEERLARKL